MAARTQRLIVGALLLAMCAWGMVDAARTDAGQAAAPTDVRPRRIVSLVPAVTEMLFAIGAGPQVVGVGSFDAYPPEVATLPRVGALLDPHTERILSLRPTLVITYGSQTDLQQQFDRAGIRTYVYRHAGVETIFQTIRDIGDATGRRAEADRVARDLRARITAVEARVKGRVKPKVALVFGRQPGTLREIYVSGGWGFLHDMLEIAGGRNVFGEVARESVQPSLETLMARAPEVILELRAVGLTGASDLADEAAPWLALSSLPAVRNRRIHLLAGEYLVVPGPRFAQATEAFARALHPEAFR